MSSKSKIKNLFLIAWPITLVVAFLVGRSLSITRPSQKSTLESELASNQLSDTPVAVAKEANTHANSVEAETGEIPIDEASNPLELIRTALTTDDPLKQMSILANAFSGLTRDNIHDAIKLFEQMPGGDVKQQMYRLLLNTWGKLDPLAALDYVGNNPSSVPMGRWGPRESSFILSGWAEVNPTAALDYAEQNGADNRGRNPLLFATLRGWANTDIEGATTYALNYSMENDSGGRRGPRMEHFLINQLIQTDVSAAADWAISHESPETREQAVKSTASGWARSDPEAALDWATNLADSTLSKTAVKSTLKTWGRENPISASEYVVSLDEGESRDSASATLSTQLVRDEPEIAALMAASITDTDLQSESLANVMTRWMRRDADAATSWVESSDLPEETKTILLSPDP